MNVVYKRECVVCRKVFRLPTTDASIPEHPRQDGLPCNGYLHQGKMLGQGTRIDDSSSTTAWVASPMVMISTCFPICSLWRWSL